MTALRLALSVAADTAWAIGDAWGAVGNVCAGWARGLR